MSGGAAWAPDGKSFVYSKHAPGAIITVLTRVVTGAADESWAAQGTAGVHLAPAYAPSGTEVVFADPAAQSHNLVLAVATRTSVFAAAVLATALCPSSPIGSRAWPA